MNDKKSLLINGRIPAGTPCPWLHDCRFKVHTCPGGDLGVKAVNFSCAAARLHDILHHEPDGGANLPIRRMVKKSSTDNVIIEDDDGSID